MADALFESSKAFLLSTDDQGRSLYDHLTALVENLVATKPEDALIRLEEISLQVKQERFSTAARGPATKPTAFTIAEDDARQQCEAMFKPIRSKPAHQDSDEPVDLVINDGSVRDVFQDAQYFEQCGIGFSKEELFRIALALRRLVEQNPLKRARLFGKFLGLQGDYIVAETEFKAGEHPSQRVANETPRDEDTEKPAPPAEEHGAGTNRFAYWVCSFAGQDGGSWTLLPDVTPQQITAARKIKKYLTGDLEAAVESYPPFPGDESNLLRAQIARIAFATAISPKGLLALYGEEAEEEGQDPPEPGSVKADFEPIEGDALLELESWVHHEPEILSKQGRVSFWKEPKEGDEDDAEEEEEPEEGKEAGDALSEDVDGWSAVRCAKLIPQYPVVLLRSRRWPGAHAYAADNGQKSGCIYVGWGHKFTGQAYNPQLPAPVASDVIPETLVETEDPTFEAESEFDKLDQQAIDEAQADADAGLDDDDEDA